MPVPCRPISVAVPPEAIENALVKVETPNPASEKVGLPVTLTVFEPNAFTFPKMIMPADAVTPPLSVFAPPTVVVPVLSSVRAKTPLPLPMTILAELGNEKLPVPANVSVVVPEADGETKLLIVTVLEELFVHVCESARAIFRRVVEFWPSVTAAAPGFIVMPLVPSVSVRVDVTGRNVIAAAFAKVRPSAVPEALSVVVPVDALAK